MKKNIAPDLQRFHKKIVKEAIIKSLLAGFASGFGLTVILATIFYFIRFDGTILGIILGLVAGGVLSWLFYRYAFYPDIKETARRLDKLGLDERMITMLEFEQEVSYIVQRQREDTFTKIKEIPEKSFKFVDLAKYIVLIALAAIACVSMSVVLAFEVQPKSYTITWKIDDVTETSQWLENTLPTHPNPTKEGFVFQRWEPTIQYVSGNATYTAVFRLQSQVDEDLIITQLLESLRELINNADVSQGLKTDLHGLVDQLEQSLQPDDSLLVKIAKIEDTRQEIIRRIQAEIRTIASELQKYETTEALGDVVAQNKPVVLNAYIEDFIEMFENMPDGLDKVELLLQTADDIEKALEDSNENNPGLRSTLQALADELRRMAIYTISEALQDHETTKTLGDAVALRDSDLLQQFIEEFVQKFIDMPMSEDKIQLLTDTADDIDLSLEESNEDNPPLREILHELAELLRSMIPKIEDETIPEDQLAEELEEQLQDIIDQLDELLNPQPSNNEEELQDDIEDAIQDAIDDLLGNNPDDPEDPEDPMDPEDPEDPTDPNEGEVDPEDEGPGGGTDDENPKVIDGQTNYVEELINLKADLIARLSDPNLTESERATINQYISNIDALIENAT